MKKKQITRKLFGDKGEAKFTWLFNESDQNLFSASEYYPDGHGANMAIRKFEAINKRKSLGIEMRIVAKGGRATTGSCTIEGEGIRELIVILTNELTKMDQFEIDGDIISKE